MGGSPASGSAIVTLLDGGRNPWVVINLSRERRYGKLAAERGAGLKPEPAGENKKGQGGGQAAKNTNYSVRGAPHDCMRHATYSLKFG